MTPPSPCRCYVGSTFLACPWCSPKGLSLVFSQGPVLACRLSLVYFPRQAQVAACPRCSS